MSRTRAHKFFNRKILIISALIILILLVFAAYEYNQSKKRIKAPVIPSHPVQSDTSSKPPESSGKQPSSSSNNTNSTSSSGNSSGTLVAPFGSFVSNHQPGNGKPTTEESVCNTTPSAECYIQFVKDGVTKHLKPKQPIVMGQLFGTGM